MGMRIVVRDANGDMKTVCMRVGSLLLVYTTHVYSNNKLYRSKEVGNMMMDTKSGVPCSVIVIAPHSS